MQDFSRTCNKVFLLCDIDTFTLVRYLSTSSYTVCYDSLREMTSNKWD